MKAALMRLVWQRASDRCEYCQMPQAFDRTPSGRITVALLKINDQFRVELREALIAEGTFPPT